jgi:hypothetical protein
VLLAIVMEQWRMGYNNDRAAAPVGDWRQGVSSRESRAGGVGPSAGPSRRQGEGTWNPRSQHEFSSRSERRPCRRRRSSDSRMLPQRTGTAWHLSFAGSCWRTFGGASGMPSRIASMATSNRAGRSATSGCPPTSNGNPGSGPRLSAPASSTGPSSKAVESRSPRRLTGPAQLFARVPGRPLV